MTWLAPRSTRPSSWRLAGNRPGTVTSAPWSTSAYGTDSDGPTAPTGSAGSSTTRVAAQPPRLAPGDVPTPVARQQLVIARREELEQWHPRHVLGRVVGRMLAVGRAVGRAHLLAVVASVEPAAKRLPVLDRERAAR